MAIAIRGGQKTFVIQFYEYINGPLYDPDDVKITIKDPDLTEVAGSPFVYPGTVQRLSLGSYRYVWTVPSNAELGQYVGTWSGEINDYTVSGSEFFEVAESVATLGNLDTAQVINFTGVIDPLYVDPEELSPYFPEADLAEIAEAIHYASLDLKFILKLKDDEYPTDPMALEYVKAAAACALSKIYGNGNLSGPDGDTTRIQLGDLEVQKGGGGGFATSRGKILPENALTWCELAAVLRKDLLYRSVGFKAVVKGSNYQNPIPRRHFKPDAGDWPVRHRQGDLDDPPNNKNWKN